MKNFAQNQTFPRYDYFLGQALFRMCTVNVDVKGVIEIDFVTQFRI